MKEEQEKSIPGEGISDNELEVLPSNEEEEKEEILLTTSKPLKKPSKASQQKIQERIMPSLSKQLDKQGTQVNKIIQMLQPVQRQINSAQRHSELLRQIHSQLKELQTHISQIQKGIGATAIRKQKKRKVHHTRSTNG